MKLEGKAILLGDNIDTDVIIPAQYCITTDEQYLAKYCLSDIRKNFYESVDKGDIIFAGKNFGCGSSREAAPIALMACGISCVIAKSFSRIFYRNAINLGLYVIENSEVQDKVKESDNISISFDEEVIFLNGEKLSKLERNNNKIINDIIENKGLINYLISNDCIRR